MENQIVEAKVLFLPGDSFLAEMWTQGTYSEARWPLHTSLCSCSLL